MKLEIQDGAVSHEIHVESLLTVSRTRPTEASFQLAGSAVGSDAGDVVAALKNVADEEHAFRRFFADVPNSASDIYVVQHQSREARSDEYSVATNTIVVLNLRHGARSWLHNQGAMVIDEERGVTLVYFPEGGERGIRKSFKLAQQLVREKRARAAAPNFVRLRTQSLPEPTDLASFNQGSMLPWAFAKIGANRAWTRTCGHSNIRVAVLDDGVDDTHPALAEAVIATRDFFGKQAYGRPEGSDTHGTACAGLIAARSVAGAPMQGLAPCVSILAARIIRRDTKGHLEAVSDLGIVNAIKWACEEQADVISCSWEYGDRNPTIKQAIKTAQREGRRGNGVVFVVAAGNHQTNIGFPGNVGGVVTVGASDRADAPKQRGSSEEPHWGSNFGPSLSFLAPGLGLTTTCASTAGDAAVGNYTTRFSGTSGSAPIASAAAALLLTLRPRAKYKKVRRQLASTCDKAAGQTTKWSQTHGYGRLNVGAALWRERR
ncbi:MAG: S8 family serine peptidase [Myxococcales bacterium]|nr:S8 family serine peptidase [Myxococcales bacterium]